MSVAFYPFSWLGFEVLGTVHRGIHSIARSTMPSATGFGSITSCLVTACFPLFHTALNSRSQTVSFPLGLPQLHFVFGQMPHNFCFMWYERLSFGGTKKYAELVLFNDITELGAWTQGPRGRKVCTYPLCASLKHWLESVCLPPCYTVRSGTYTGSSHVTFPLLPGASASGCLSHHHPGFSIKVGFLAVLLKYTTRSLHDLKMQFNFSAN